MKTSIIKQEEPQKGLFPVIALNLQHNFITLFTSAGVGTVLHDPSGIWGLGYYSESWVSVAESTQWKILGDITIKFES